MNRNRYIFFLGGFLIFGFVGWSVYNYLFDASTPIIMLNGIDEHKYYSGDVQCGIESSKRGEVSVWLDNAPLNNKHVITARDMHPFVIPTRTISNGMHMLRIDVVDSSFAKNKSTIEKKFFVDNQLLQASLITCDDIYKVFQGRTLHVQVQANKEIQKAEVTVLSNTYECFPESAHSTVYEAFIPVPCEETPNEYLMSINVTDRVGNSINLENKIQVVVFPFKRHTLSVSEQKMQEEEALGPDHKRFEEIMHKLTLASPKQKLWKGAFCTPMDITKITCEFGTERTTQRKGRYTHRAIDAINIPRSVVWAPQDGTVVLIERFADTGNTVIIDHGFGILSMFCHLEDFAKINVGQTIAKGNPIGRMGKTGYATGYHLHWEMRINNIPVDPMQWTKINF